MLELFRLVAGAAILAAAGSFCGCSAVPSPDQKLGVTIAVPGFGSLDVGYSSGKAIGAISGGGAAWTITPGGSITTSAAAIIPEENRPAAATATR